MKPFNNNMLLERIKSVRKMSRNSEKRTEDTSAVGSSGGENLESRVTNMLHEIGIPAHIKGYHYLRDAIIMAVNDMDVLNAIRRFFILRWLRSIRQLPAVWRGPYGMPSRWRGAGGKLDTLDELFGYTVSTGKGKPTNSEFIALIADTIQLEYRHRN